jgi:Tfp pilus assembly protein PilF
MNRTGKTNVRTMGNWKFNHLGGTTLSAQLPKTVATKPVQTGRHGTILVFGLGCSLIAGSMMFWVAGAPNASADGIESSPPSTLAGGAPAPTTPGSKSDTTPTATAAPSASGVTPAAAQKAGEAYAKGKALVAAKEWADAIIQLGEADKAQPNNADTNNLLGYSNRKIGKLDISLVYYKKALAIDPKHLGAHEYLGELYLMMNDPTKAKTELSTLLKLCGAKCEQYLDLKKAVAGYKPALKAKKK